MKIILFTHPDFLGHQSMPRFARMLNEGMKKRGHDVQIWSPRPKFFKFSNHKFLSKWLGYIDQYIVFPIQVRKQIKAQNNTLFVFTDQALGPWVPLVKGLPHVVHCHDFLAQRSALGEIAENPTGFTGKLYQDFIRRGYSKAKNFISVSNKTNEELQRFLVARPDFADVVYNGLNQSFKPFDPVKAKKLLNEKTGIDLERGFILHVGGNQWYKNRLGVIEIYNSWRSLSKEKLPLILIGENPTTELEQKKQASDYAADIHFLNGITDDLVQMAYCGASVMLFPSYAEGFGWPIAEAMASGCPVITTDLAPMTEVAGDAGFLIPVRPAEPEQIVDWAGKAGEIIEKIVNLTVEERESVVKAGIENSKRFETNAALNRIESIYQEILN